LKKKINGNYVNETGTMPASPIGVSARSSSLAAGLVPANPGSQKF
jgi:hypothetical protein